MAAQEGLPAAASPPTATARLTSSRSRIEQIEAGLRRPTLAEAGLLALRADLEPLREEVDGIANDEQPKVDALRAQLEKFGKKPGEKDPPEAEAVARERADLERRLRESEETLRVAAALQVRIAQTETAITDRRRALFTDSLFLRSRSPLSPWLWSDVLTGLPRDLKAARTIGEDWFVLARDRFLGGGAIPIVGGLLLLLVFLGPARRRLARLDPRDKDLADPPPLKRAVGAAVAAVTWAAPAAVVAFGLNVILDASGIVPRRLNAVVWAVLSGVALIGLLAALSRAILAPQRAGWRLVTMEDREAQTITAMVATAGTVLVTGKIADAVIHAIGGGLSLSVLSRAMFTLAFGGVIAAALHNLKRDNACDEHSLGPYVPTVSEAIGLARTGLMLAIAASAAAVLAGYVALGAFLADQIVWIGVIAAVLLLVTRLIDEGLANGVAENSTVSAFLTQSVGLRRRSLDQFAVVVSGIARLAVIVAAAMLVVAPWGIESGDLVGTLRAAIFGFRVGDVTISLSSIAVAGGLFVVGIVATRGLQRWLDARLLPRTELDAGLKNSIRTALGYCGFLVAASLAVSSLGLSLDRIAIVAGALSLGIGFGLQSIVGNFVSGLILLWERSIKVGDWILVGEEQGIVRRINVRSTEIETFDRSSVIVPNSNLVSGVVKNRVHRDRTGRVLLTVSVPRDSDPQLVAKVLESAARAHAGVVAEPPPRAFFKKINDLTLDFELVCFVPEVDTTGLVTSDLNFAVHNSLAENGLHRQVTRPVLDALALERIGEVLAGASHRPSVKAAE